MKDSDYIKSILNAFHDLLFVFTSDGIIADYLTPNQEDELIQPKEVFLGKHHREVLPGHVCNKIERAFNKIDQGKDQVKFDYSIELNGDKHWFVAVISKIDYRQQPRYLGAVRNITNRKSQELLIQGILNTSPAGILVLHAIRNRESTIIDFEITHTNRMMDHIIKIPETDVAGNNLSVVFPDTVGNIMLPKFKSVIKTGEKVDFDYQFEPNTGETTWFNCKAAKFKDGLVVSFLDITNQKKVEEELVTTNKQLKELNRQKDKLFSVISHDLKNAISGSLGTYEVILEDYDEFTKEELLEYLTLMRNKTKNASDLLHDLLLWSKNQFQDVTPDPLKINLAEIVSSVFKNIKPIADDKQIELINKVQDNLFVYADANMAKTVLRNLVTNGIKFSHPGDTILVEAVKKEEQVEVAVTDHGVGIKEDVMEKLLDKKVNYTSRGTKGEKGSGLGLDLCKDFVEKHEGNIWVKSEPGKGSTFTFTLPHYNSS